MNDNLGYLKRFSGWLDLRQDFFHKTCIATWNDWRTYFHGFTNTSDLLFSPKMNRFHPSFLILKLPTQSLVHCVFLCLDVIRSFLFLVSFYEFDPFFSWHSLLWFVPFWLLLYFRVFLFHHLIWTWISLKFPMHWSFEFCCQICVDFLSYLWW